MIKREVLMPVELVEEIAQIVHKESYEALKEAFPNGPQGQVLSFAIHSQTHKAKTDSEHEKRS